MKLSRPIRVAALLYTLCGLGFIGCARRQGPQNIPAGEPMIVSLQAEFHTQDDDKDERNGITETFTYNTRVIGESRSYHNNVRFRENTQNSGYLVVLSRDNQVPVSDIGAVTYRYVMDTDDGWDVLIRIKARDNRGNEHLVAEETREIGDGKPRQGMIQLRARP